MQSQLQITSVQLPILLAMLLPLYPEITALERVILAV